MTNPWPGDPQHLWDATVTPGTPRWVPTAADLPDWSTPATFERHYEFVPTWWRRFLLAMVVVPLAVVATVMVVRHWDGYGGVKQALAALLLLVVVGFTIALLVHLVVAEVRLQRGRPHVLPQIHAELQEFHVPVWAVLVGALRLADRSSGPNDTPDDLLFVFDLRVPPATLRRQLHVAETWVAQVAASEASNVPAALGEAFDRRDAVHATELFGEGMRGVWMWCKPSVLPRYLLGLALADPQSDELTDEVVFFTRTTSREQRRRSRLITSVDG